MHLDASLGCKELRHPKFHCGSVVSRLVEDAFHVVDKRDIKTERSGLCMRGIFTVFAFTDHTEVADVDVQHGHFLVGYRNWTRGERGSWGMCWLMEH